MEVRLDKELDCTNKHFWADAMMFQQPNGCVWLHISNRAPEDGGAWGSVAVILAAWLVGLGCAHRGTQDPNLIGDILIADGTDGGEWKRQQDCTFSDVNFEILESLRISCHSLVYIVFVLKKR